MQQTEMKWINIEQLKPHPQNPRIFMRDEVVDGIANGIKQRGEFGQEHAILVRPSNGGFEIIAGHHRVEGAKRAELEKIPTWVRDMADDEAYMLLLQDNNQKELAPLEIGLHALRSDLSLRSYSEQTGYTHNNIIHLKKAAEVYLSISGKSIYHDDTGKSIYHFFDKTTHLSEINAAPKEAWIPLVEYLFSEDGITVSKIKGKVKSIKDLEQSIPEWWPVNKENLFDTAIKNDTKSSQLAKLFAEAKKIADNFNIVKLYTKERTEEIVSFDGRDFYKVIPRQFEYDERSDFIEKISSLEGLPKVDQVRAIANDIKSYSKQHSSDKVEYSPVLTDSEVKQAEAERKRQQQIELENAELLKLKQGDCLTFLKFWQRETIDLLLTDPPYGIDFQSNRRTASDKAEKIDNDTLDKALGLLDNMLKHAVPNMSENSIAVIWYDDRYQKQFEDIAKKNGLEVKTYLIWHKPNHGSGDLNIPAPNYEPALFCTKGNPVINKRIDRCIGTDKKEVYTDHPTEKPLSLLKTWVDAFTNESDLVVDPFMGTGSAILAAYELGRNVWGAEISEGYYEQAKERFLKLYRKKAAR